VFIPYPVVDRQKSSIGFEELSNLFLRRRSVRWYKEIEVPTDLITKAIDVAVQAPSACNRQPYRFVISENGEMAREIAELAGGTPGWLHNINSLVVVIGDLSSYPYERDRHLIYIDGGLVCMQFLLALETLGLSSCSINWPDVPIPEKKMADLLKLKQHERPVMLISIGYPLDAGMVPFSQKKDSVTLSTVKSRDK
jgi:nitroreductase